MIGLLVLMMELAVLGLLWPAVAVASAAAAAAAAAAVVAAAVAAAAAEHGSPVQGPQWWADWQGVRRALQWVRWH